MTPIINGILEGCLTGLVVWQHNTSDDETATRLMYGVFQTQVTLVAFVVMVFFVVVVFLGVVFAPATTWTFHGWYLRDIWS